MEAIINKFKPPSIKTQLIIFLLVFAVYLAIISRDWKFLPALLIAVLVSAGAEAIPGVLRTKRIVFSSSAVITGLMLGYVLADDQAWWKIVSAAVIAIASKVLLRFRGKHIFNPAAFGILFSVLVFGVFTQWKGTYLWQILMPFGFYFVYKIRKLELLTGYIAVTLILFGTQAVFQKVPFGNIFGYISYFFVFVMMIEPKTTPAKPFAKYIFGASIAVAIFTLTQIGVSFDAELAALLVLNLAVPFLNKLHAGFDSFVKKEGSQ